MISGGRTETEIIRRYRAGENSYEVADALRMSQRRVWEVLHAAGATRARRDARMLKRHRLHGADIEDRVVARYLAGHSTYQVADDLCISQGMVGRILRERKVPRRPFVEAIRLHFKVAA